MIDDKTRQLITELAVVLRGWMGSSYPHGGAPHHSYMSLFTSACRSAWRVGVAFPTDQQGLDTTERPYSEAESGHLPAYFRALPEQEARRRLATLPLDEFDLQELLRSYVGTMDYEEGFNGRKGWFTISERERPLIEALCECGFAEEAEGQYRWTEKMFDVARRESPGGDWKWEGT